MHTANIFSTNKLTKQGEGHGRSRKYGENIKNVKINYNFCVQFFESRGFVKLLAISLTIATEFA